MIIAANLVLLFKAQKGNETENKYEDVLHKNGFKTEQLKSIDFNFINLDKLQEKLMNPDAYQGIIFSSPRCVEGVAKALKRSKLNTEWKNKHNYVVGEMTYKCAFEDLGLDCMGKDSGNGEKLSAIIIKDVSMQDSRPFLMPCGNLKTDTIETRLNEFKIPTEAVTVYETITNPNFAREFSNVTDDFEKIPEFMVFFSPSGVKAFSNCLAGKFKHYLNSIKMQVSQFMVSPKSLILKNF
ncbi:uroporphyrinogen-III synthase isoform X2 [Agrilus planipennis]|uniref:Uroporphyrinogen-III synthase n=1 Tax=Agrilus planipennis TaxID=224129 RepID=A0A1W4XVB1_AGRPL|nr:uroporphyrinogen-III synthase isoform X2 [Agrilus planipennis]